MEISAGRLTLEQLETLYREPVEIVLDRGCREPVEQASEIVRAAVRGNDAIYGINTGFGKLANTRIETEQTAQLQRNLILSHCCGVGSDLPDAVVRLVMVLKLASLGCGASGVRWQLVERLEAMINSGVLPVIPAKGSVGASGDLAPLAHMTAAMIGEGNVNYRGRKTSAESALKGVGLESMQLGPKEGLAMINGTQVSTALALAGLFDSWRSCRSALITGAISSDALMASTAPFRPEVHKLRGHQGQLDAAETLRELLDGSAIRESHRDDDERVQDPYCLRCQPQVMGACIDQLRHVAKTLVIEANAVTDNPLVITESSEILSGGNFHAEPVSFAADQCALVIAEIGSITERRIATMVDPALNYGLPAFLSPSPGLNSGFMIAEVTAAALMSENKQRAAPCSIDSTPTSANQEDHVSMACHGAYRLMEMNRNLATIIAIELLTGCQGVQFREPIRTSKPLQDIVALLRKEVSQLVDDRYLATDINIAARLVGDGKLVEVVGMRSLPALH
jgi:histidine ammonia-lyase